MGFIFNLPPAFGSLYVPYFTTANVAKIAVVFETYYIVINQYGSNFIQSDFPHKAEKVSYLARHVAIKNKVQYLARLTCISCSHAENFCKCRNDSFNAHPWQDAALM